MMFVPSSTAMPPGLNTIDDGLVFVAAAAPAQPGVRASCSLTLNAFADATLEEPTTAAKRKYERFFMVLVLGYWLLRNDVRSTCRRCVPNTPACVSVAGLSSDGCTKMLFASVV